LIQKHRSDSNGGLNDTPYEVIGVMPHSTKILGSVWLLLASTRSIT